MPQKDFELLESVFDSTSEYISVIDRQYRYKVVNDAYTKHYGITKKEIEGKYLYEVIDSNSFETIKINLGKTFNGESVSYERWFYFPQKDERKYMLVSYVPYRRGGQIIGAIAFIRDYTEQEHKRMELEEQSDLLMHKAKMVEVGESLSFISHQWRQQLNILSSYLLRLRQELFVADISNHTPSSLERCEMVLESLSETMEKFLIFYRQEDKKKNFRITDALNLVIEILELRFQKLKVNFEVVVEKEIEIFGSHNHLSQVFFVIFQNSLDAFAKNSIKNPQIKVLFSNKKERLCIEIIDNAGGIEKEKLKKVFQKRVEKQKGFGLGLYFVQIILQKSFGAQIQMQNYKRGVKTTILF